MTKQPILNEAKPPIWKRDTTTNFENETKQPISEIRHNRRFQSVTKLPIW